MRVVRSHKADFSRLILPSSNGYPMPWVSRLAPCWVQADQSGPLVVPAIFWSGALVHPSPLRLRLMPVGDAGLWVTLRFAYLLIHICYSAPRRGLHACIACTAFWLLCFLLWRSVLRLRMAPALAAPCVLVDHRTEIVRTCSSAAFRGLAACPWALVCR